MNTTAHSARRAYDNRLAFYHPTQSGGGAAARLEFHPVRPDRDGCFFLEMARQKTAVGRNEAGKQTATFDWEGKITVKLGFMDICGLLLVLEGRCEQAGGGRGLFHDTPGANTVINLRHQADPPGFALEVSRKPKRAGAEPQRARVLLSEVEGLGVRCVFQSALFHLVFSMLAQDSQPQGQEQETERQGDSATGAPAQAMRGEPVQ
jgi:hypothetical protein